MTEDAQNRFVGYYLSKIVQASLQMAGTFALPGLVFFLPVSADLSAAIKASLGLAMVLFTVFFASYWLSLIALIGKLAANGDMNKVTGAELFQNVQRRIFSVSGDLESTLERVLQVLSADKSFRVSRLDLVGGTIEVMQVSGMVRLRTVEIHVEESGPEESEVRIVSYSPTALFRYLCDIPIIGLPQVLALEKAIKSPEAAQTHVGYGNLFSKTRLPRLRPIQTLLVLLLGLGTANCLLFAGDPSAQVSNLLQRASDAESSGHYRRASMEASAAVQRARRARGEYGKQLLESALTTDATEYANLVAQSAEQNPDKLLAVSKHAESTSRLNRARLEFNEALQLNSRNANAVCGRAFVSALLGDMAGAQADIARYEQLRNQSHDDLEDVTDDNSFIPRTTALLCHHNGDDVAAIAGLNTSDMYDDSSMAVGEMKLALLKSLQPHHPQLASEITQLAADIQDARKLNTTSGADSAEQPLSEAGQSFAWFLAIFQFLPIGIGLFLKDLHLYFEGRPTASGGTTNRKKTTGGVLAPVANYAAPVLTACAGEVKDKPTAQPDFVLLKERAKDPID